jgi:hypothetical protein
MVCEVYSIKDGRNRKATVRERPPISTLPYELFVQKSFYAKKGKDLVSWIKSCKGYANFGV